MLEEDAQCILIIVGYEANNGKSRHGVKVMLVYMNYNGDS